MNKKVLMDRIIQKFENKAEFLSPEKELEIRKNWIDVLLRRKKNELYIIAMEEMAELTQVLSKMIRYDIEVDNINLLEEMTDVQICLDNLKLHLVKDEEKFQYIKDIKLERLADKMNEEEGEYSGR